MLFGVSRGSFGFPRGRFGMSCVSPKWYWGGIAVPVACLWVISSSWDSFISCDWLSGLVLSRITWAFLFFPRPASPCFFWCWIGLDCVALSLALSCLALWALSCRVWFGWTSFGISLFLRLVLPCLAAPCLDILISVALVYSPLL